MENCVSGLLLWGVPSSRKSKLTKSRNVMNRHLMNHSCSITDNPHSHCMLAFFEVRLINMSRAYSQTVGDFCLPSGIRTITTGKTTVKPNIVSCYFSDTELSASWILSPLIRRNLWKCGNIWLCFVILYFHWGRQSFWKRHAVCKLNWNCTAYLVAPTLMCYSHVIYSMLCYSHVICNMQYVKKICSTFDNKNVWNIRGSHISINPVFQER